MKTTIIFLRPLLLGFQGLHSALCRPGVNRSISEPDDDGGDGDVDPYNEHGPEEDSPDNQTLLRLLEEKEKVSYPILVTFCRDFGPCRIFFIFSIGYSCSVTFVYEMGAEEE